MPQDSISTLRNDFPALALTIGVMPPRDRAYLADLLLLWLEINRARNAAESMIAAARISWWREALDHHKAEGVPLAERVLAHHKTSGRDIAPITAMLEQVVSITLNDEPGADHQVCHAMGDMLAAQLHQFTTAHKNTAHKNTDHKNTDHKNTDHKNTDHKNNAHKNKIGSNIAHALLALRGAMAGHALDHDLADTLFAADIPVPFKLMAWLAQDPSRLDYPEGQPLLPLKLMVKAFRL